MYKKQIGHFVIESLKFFFNFDHAICNHALLVVLIAAGLFKLLFVKVGDELYDGIITVKEDYMTIRSEIEAKMELWGKSEIRNTLIGNIQSLKNNLLRKNITG